MSHVRFYQNRAILLHKRGTLSRDNNVADAATVELHARCDFVELTTTAASAPLFPFHDPPSQTQFQNAETVPYLIFSELFVLQDSPLKLNYSQEYRNWSCRFGKIARDNIARVTSV